MATCDSQDIPSELLDLYKAALGEASPKGYTRKRFPFRLPSFQQGGSRVTPKQFSNRQTFLEAVSSFNALPWTDRQALYSDSSCIESGMWYYNYFVYRFLIGNPWSPGGETTMIKSIQHFLQDWEDPGDYFETISMSAVNPAKCIIIHMGVGYNYDEYLIVHPYIYTIESNYFVAKPGYDITDTMWVHFSVIEFL